MSDLGTDSLHHLIVIARAVRTRGLKGEVVADLLTDFPSRFEVIDQLTAISSRGEQKTVELEDFWFQKDRVIL
jgi:16S rRNA processing protein RimM